MTHTLDDVYELAVDVDEVKSELGLVTLTPAQEAFLRGIIRRVQSELENYLNRMVTIRDVTETGARPRVRDWSIIRDDEYVTSITGTVPPVSYYLHWPDVHYIHHVDAEVNGTYTVHYVAGLDGKNITPIKDYLIVATLEKARNHPLAKQILGITRTISSVTAASQSVTYDPLPSGHRDSTAPGAVPWMESLERWKYRTVV
jgi:hypothetical protein